MYYASTFDYIYYVLQAYLQLQRLGICLSHSATLDKLEALGKDFSKPVLSWRDWIAHPSQDRQVRFEHFHLQRSGFIL